MTAVDAQALAETVRATLEITKAVIERWMPTAGNLPDGRYVMREHRLNALESLETRVDGLVEALDALRWQKADGTYVDGCWCDVKATDFKDWHSPCCLAARAALAPPVPVRGDEPQ